MMIQLIKSVGDLIMDMLFPVCCADCGMEGEYLCGPCAQKLQLASWAKPICPGCGHHSLFGQTHMACRTTTALDGFIYSFSYNQHSVKKLIGWIKYQNIADAAHPCAKALNNILASALPHIRHLHATKSTTLLPIPLHPKRAKWRGYNQAELIARHIALTLKMPIDNSLLVKTKHTKPQAKLNKTNRVANAADSFQISKPVDADCLYVLIDDVATTRATLNQAAQQLKAAQAKAVWAATVAFEP
jgi:ComF family protein